MHAAIKTLEKSRKLLVRTQNGILLQRGIGNIQKNYMCYTFSTSNYTSRNFFYKDELAKVKNGDVAVLFVTLKVRNNPNVHKELHKILKPIRMEKDGYTKN